MHFSEYRDPQTGYVLRQYTTKDEHCFKDYFTFENFTSDDKAFYMFKDWKITKVEVSTGERAEIGSLSGFSVAFNDDYAIAYRGREVVRIDLKTDVITPIGELPPLYGITSDLSVSKSGLITGSCILPDHISALLIFDPKTNETRIVNRTDQLLGHCQFCPTDDNTILYIHETQGNAVQRIWMYDIADGRSYPYFVERRNEWITHETWTADGENVIFINYPRSIMIGDKYGYKFETVFESDHGYHHPGISRDKKHVCADRTSNINEVYYIDRAKNTEITIAKTGSPRNSAEHMHPSFNRAGTQILFNNPQENAYPIVTLFDTAQL